MKVGDFFVYNLNLTVIKLGAFDFLIPVSNKLEIKKSPL
jgi:hypothetical protein